MGGGDRINSCSSTYIGIFGTAPALGGSGLSPTFTLALVALLVAGAANRLDNMMADTILQNRVPGTLLSPP